MRNPLILLAVLAVVAIVPAQAEQIQTVCFTPGEDCRALIISEIAKAKKSIRMQAYSFTCVEIAKALTDAHKRGVDVQAVLDKGQRTEKYSGATFLHNAGISVLIDMQHAISHNKVIVIDGKTVITGSYNFTKSAQEKNAENVLVIADPKIAKLYLSNWELHHQHSEAYTK